MPESKQPHENLENIINGILSLNNDPGIISHGKRQLETKRPYPDIWVNNVADTAEAGPSAQEEEDTKNAATLEASNPEFHNVTTTEEEPELAQVVNDEISQKIALWLHSIQAHGFSPMVLQKYMAEEINEEDDDTWWDSGVVRVFQPYYDIQSDDVQEVIQGKTDKNGDPIGYCQILLKNGDLLDGKFLKDRLLQGMATIEGKNMDKHGLSSIRGFHKSGILHGQGRAVIAPNALWSHIKCEVILEGIFNDGYLEGPVRGLDTFGNLIFVGFYDKGLPRGSCWVAKEGQGWIYGEVDECGRFSGTNIAYIYPNLYTAIYGSFIEEKVEEARAAVITKAQVNPYNDILYLSFSEPAPDAHAYTYCPSNAHTIPCDWTLMDNYEKVTVHCKKSEIDGAGDGLFASVDIPSGLIVSYYNGLNIQSGEQYTPDNCNYQIYVDWANTDGSPYVDIPMQCIDYDHYRASLAHKANHSFNPNCKFIAVDHPRFGRIPALKTIKAVKKGDELFSHYKYDTALAPTWYQEAWQRSQTENNSY